MEVKVERMEMEMVRWNQRWRRAVMMKALLLMPS